jgi:hypothetical protein
MVSRPGLKKQERPKLVALVFQIRILSGGGEGFFFGFFFFYWVYLFWLLSVGAASTQMSGHGLTTPTI